MHKKIRVLSLDGGGIRGIIPATILQYVENKIIEKTGNANARLADYFDIMVGTSTGGILTCFYLTPNPGMGSNLPSAKYKAGEALDFYKKKGYAIFNQSKKHGWFGFRQLFNATRYSIETIEDIFGNEFDEVHMSELIKPCIVTTYDMVTRSAFFFNSREPENKQRDFFVRDVVRSTSAAPTYFPPAYIKNLKTNRQMVNLDGGVFANNPTMCAYAECRKMKFPQVDYPAAKDMLILSLGTGGGKINLPDVSESKKWGVINWAKSIPEIMMDGSIDTVNVQLKNLFSTLEEKHQYNYKRVDVPLDKRNYSPDMANASKENIEKLEEAGKATLEASLKDKDKTHDLDTFIDLLIKNAPLETDN